MNFLGKNFILINKIQNEIKILEEDEKNFFNQEDFFLRSQYIYIRENRQIIQAICPLCGIKSNSDYILNHLKKCVTTYDRGK